MIFLNIKIFVELKDFNLYYIYIKKSYIEFRIKVLQHRIKEEMHFIFQLRNSLSYEIVECN